MAVKMQVKVFLAVTMQYCSGMLTFWRNSPSSSP